MDLWPWSDRNPSPVFLKLIWTIMTWQALVIVCAYFGGEWFGLVLVLLVTLLAAIFFVGFFLEGLARMAIYYRDRYKEHLRPPSDTEVKP